MKIDGNGIVLLYLRLFNNLLANKLSSVNDLFINKCNEKKHGMCCEKDL